MKKHSFLSSEDCYFKSVACDQPNVVLQSYQQVLSVLEPTVSAVKCSVNSVNGCSSSNDIHLSRCSAH